MCRKALAQKTTNASTVKDIIYCLVTPTIAKLYTNVITNLLVTVYFPTLHGMHVLLILPIPK